MKNSDKKGGVKALAESARLAMSVPETQFWADVNEQLELKEGSQRPVVERRRDRGYVDDESHFYS